MGSEELLAKRILRLTSYLKDTREPRGPEHMAKMKAARGPYSDPRDTHIASMIRYAFEHSDGKPVSTAQLVEEIYGWQLRLKGKAKQSYHYEAIRRALRKVATPIDRASTRGRSVLWKPDERMELRSSTGRTNRRRNRQVLPPITTDRKIDVLRTIQATDPSKHPYGRYNHGDMPGT